MSRTSTERESAIENYLAERVKASGGEIRKVVYPGRKHAPDRLAFWPTTPMWYSKRTRAVWVELKRPGLKDEARDGQKRERDRLLAAGFDARIIDSREEIDVLVNHYGWGPLETYEYGKR